MTFIVDNNFDDVLAGMKRQAYADAYRTNERAVIATKLDGHTVTCQAERRPVKGRLTLIATWMIDGHRRGFNAVCGALRKGA